MSKMAIDTYRSASRATDYAEATALASGGLEAVRSMAGRDWSLLVNGTHGIGTAGGLYVFSGTSDAYGPYTRAVTVSDALRNAQDEIVEAGGTAEPTTKRVVSTVSWQPDGSTQTVSVTVVSYMARWRAYASSVSSMPASSAPAASSSAAPPPPPPPVPPPPPPPAGSCSSAGAGEPDPCASEI
jgi:hypothetical protein